MMFLRVLDFDAGLSARIHFHQRAKWLSFPRLEQVSRHYTYLMQQARLTIPTESQMHTSSL